MHMENRHNTYNTLHLWHNFRLKLVGEGIIVGALSGLLVVAYRLSLQKIEMITKSIYLMQLEKTWLIPIWFVCLIIGACIVGAMVKKDPMISGSGIPQVEGILLGLLTANWWKVIIRKFIGGVISIGAGLSLGREGPSIQLGASVGQGFSKIFKRIKIEEKYLMTSGASAGLAAAFNAPLAGVIFALEEIHKNFSPLVLISAASASITADFISKEFFGLKPVFQFNNLSALPLNYYGYIIILGIILGFLGAFYNSILLKTQKLYSKQKWLPIQFRPIIPFMLAGVLGLTLPEILGGGHELVISLIEKSFMLKFLIVLLVIKFAFSMISFGSGAPGGIFFPLLVLGALIGIVYVKILIYAFGFDSNYINNFIILGMAGYFTAIVRAPITGSILITEMTGSFTHLLSLSTVAIIAYIVADLLKSKPVYESLLERILNNNNHHNIVKDSKAKNIIEIPVHHGCSLEGKEIKQFNWPQKCLLVAIKRGEKEIIPKGDTIIYAGDYLVVLINEEDRAEITKTLVYAAETP
ncbi:ClC family H(+)/Cl(-) exchange transporter [Clostridium sp. CX1]|uniref:ClC family H(+)/Cl(-) exchange transporter n=1 Tax=Clostridium sp. CX1 TaxID=2978346 RepID=UPI0021C03341|nr:ClC family H(+)/Cl(-) exchange transporter [Clostridium sp. CX1]MCT8975419.1 ClC family H(+)/Cl(-) exchange transporter [Clostridium sp. CX1]